MSLHPTDAEIVDIWSRIVSRDGFGENSARVGWLREGISLNALTEEFLSSGLVPFSGGKPRAGKTFVDLASS